MMRALENGGATDRRTGGVPRLHLVTSDEVLSRPDWTSSAVEAMEAGGVAVAIHLRGPATDGATLFGLAVKLLPEARRTGAWLVVNDRVDVAVTTAADGVHLGARSLAVGQARALLGDERRIGVSAHLPGEISRARREGADFAFMGTIYPTPSHQGLPGMGLSGLREAAPASGGLPVMGIGGIGVEHVAGVLGAGAHGVAVVRGVWDRGDAGTAVRDYVHAIGETIDD